MGATLAWAMHQTKASNLAPCEILDWKIKHPILWLWTSSCRRTLSAAQIPGGGGFSKTGNLVVNQPATKIQKGVFQGGLREIFFIARTYHPREGRTSPPPPPSTTYLADARFN